MGGMISFLKRESTVETPGTNLLGLEARGEGGPALRKTLLLATAFWSGRAGPNPGAACAA